MQESIKSAINKIKKIPNSKSIQVISHFDTDGITSAAIFSRVLERLNKKFSLKVVKNLEASFVESLSEDKVLIFLDLASSFIQQLSQKNTEILIIDHHEITDQKIPENITIINPTILSEENISSSALCYLIAKAISPENKDLANLAVIGMVGDMHEKNISRNYKIILEDSEAIVKRGLLLYPATRPLEKVLENASGIYIPDVTGSFKGTNKLLRDAEIAKTSAGFKSLAELTDEEMSRLTTAIMLKKIGSKSALSDLMGNIYLINFFNRMEDAREISALINACSRMNYPEIALGFCLGNKEIKQEAEKIYIKYKQNISSAMKEISEINKLSGNNYIIINAKDRVKDTIIGTTASIMSFSPLYEKGTVIIAMANSEGNKIKVSARIAGRKGRNVFSILNQACHSITEEIGGHPNAAGCLIPIEKENEFINNLKNILEIEMIKV